MFEKTRNIERAFQLIRLFCIAVVVACMAMTTVIVMASLHAMEKDRNTVYVLAAGKAFEAFAGSRDENIPVEARDHIRTFHEWFFTLSPDEKEIQANTTRALYLADESAKKFYGNLKENGFYAGIIAGNIRHSIVIDSIQLDTRVYPFYFRCWAIQTIVRPRSKVTRDLITEGYLRRIDRTENVPHGFIIERWNTLENKDLKVEER